MLPEITHGRTMYRVHVHLHVTLHPITHAQLYIQCTCSYRYAEPILFHPAGTCMYSTCASICHLLNISGGQVSMSQVLSGQVVHPPGHLLSHEHQVLSREIWTLLWEKRETKRKQ